MKASRNIIAVSVFLTVAVLLNILFWFEVRDMRPEWGNVPPVPDHRFIQSMGLGDASFAYRSNGIMLQNLGDTGGRLTPLKDYDYDRLTEWFFLQDKLDPRSDYIPYLAAYYFSAVQIPEKFSPVLDYLAEVGVRSDGQKWRWLAQAVYVSRFLMKDIDKALELAQLLSRSVPDSAPAWAHQMPVFVANAKGDKGVAYALMLEILKSNADQMHPNEVRSTRAYICDRILNEVERQKDPLCEGEY